jgi:hypothetical protein
MCKVITAIIPMSLDVVMHACKLLRRLKQKDHEFKASLGYRVRVSFKIK